MADAQSDADKIRNKRLAKLGGQATSSPNNGASSSDTPRIASPSSPQNMAPPKAGQAETTPGKQQAAASDPFDLSSQHKTPSAPTTPSASRIKINTPQGDSATRSRSRQGGPLTQEAWEDVTLSDIFRIALDPNHRTNVKGEPLRYLEGVRSDLESSHSPLRIDLTNLDQAIVEAGTNNKAGKPLKYLLGCWKRVMRTWRNQKSTSLDDPKMRVLLEVKRIIMSYCIFATTMPEMFEQESDGSNPLAEALLLDSEDDGGICHDFLAEAISRFAEDESIKEALVGAMEQLSRELAGKSMNDSFKPYVTALHTFSRYQPLAEALTNSPLFIPDGVTADRLEVDSLLGPFFRLSPLQGEVAANYFAGARARDEAFIRNSQDALRLTLRSHQEQLINIVNCMVKNAAARSRILDWFALTVNLNHKRRAFHVEKNTVSSDGFMINVTAILDMLCEPFMDASFTKVDRIEVDYFRRSPRVNIQDETKINADQTTSDEFYATEAAPPTASTFISEVFFLTVAAHHYGTEAANTKLDQLRKDLKNLEKQIRTFEAERVKFTQNPAQLAQFEVAVKKYKDRLENGTCVVNAVSGVLLDETTQQRSMLLMRYIIVWLMRLVMPPQDRPENKYPHKQVRLPLPEQQPNVFRCLPEYFIEDIVDNFKFITSHMPFIVQSTQCDELLTMCITFLRSSEYIKNPGLKAGLVQILYYGVVPYRAKPKGIMGDILNSSKFALEHLFHALMKFYIEAETTGSHTQFYDKFNIRYEIFQVIRCIWTNPDYRDKLLVESKINTTFFVQFVNLTLNDVTFLLDESFTAFKKIRGLQEELEGDAAATMDEKTREEKQQLLDQTQGSAKNWMQLTNETISMLKLFTSALADAFTSPEIVQRLADMLDYNLDSMVGPKQKELKVRDPLQYSFKPLELLSDLTSVYLNLRDKTNFQLAVARDGRSYKHSTLVHAAEIMAKSSTSLKSPDELREFRAMADSIEATKLADDKAEEMLGEIPDEYVDPIMASLMEDPVILPISRQTVDRSTIMSHLLSDPHDPFNRTPLKIEDVIPNIELKEQIEAFRAEARERAKKEIEKEMVEAAAAEAEAEKMDETDG
ncbi:putative ubiquitin fusion degradation protein UfdB [Tothia fuscella]|uniref:Ubiquitin fusion degradation protein UfdB n=1 Tax=Tothia fuscella TaxID=1048955 RepID=A0A9P4NTF6_9PEZI|nr:putative ubiquitin fusion degradation protein UfdB [Tothia fuscella]